MPSRLAGNNEKKEAKTHFLESTSSIAAAPLNWNLQLTFTNMHLKFEIQLRSPVRPGLKSRFNLSPAGNQCKERKCLLIGGKRAKAKCNFCKTGIHD